MKQNVTEKSPKVAHFYQCEQCDYNTSKKYDFTKHLLTIKHKKCENVTLCNKMKPKVATTYVVTFLVTNRTKICVLTENMCCNVDNIRQKEYKKTVT
jgi:hypothetical protein